MIPSCFIREGAKKVQPNELAHIIEAILFVAGEPVSLEDLIKALDVTEVELRAALDRLESEYDFNRRGIRLNRFGSHVQLATRAEFAPYVERLLQPVQKQSLSQKAMETLAVVAYRQPVTKGDIEAVRGMKCDYSVQSLVNKGLIEEVGRKDALGRPILYGTTDKFLEHFGISSLAELPQLPEMEDMTQEDAETLIP